MSYAYYPGCSLTMSAVEYDASTRAVLHRLGTPVAEIADWTCCGASAAESVSRLLSFALPARNLALAGRQMPGEDLLVPCSACYLNLLRVEVETKQDKRLLADLNEVLAEEGLTLRGAPRVRHLLDVLAADIGPARIGEAVVKPLEGLVIAPYYGCQALRPYPRFDDPERPMSMAPLIEALGAQAHPWDMGAKCCGASLMATKKEVALESVAALLRAAQGADAIATVCPMCQMNLEAYQDQAFRRLGRGGSQTIVYLPQLMGLAFGLPEKEVLMGKNMAVSAGFLDKAAQAAAGKRVASQVNAVNQAP